VASLPKLWAGMRVNRTKLRTNGLTELYNINRFKKVKKIILAKMHIEVEQIERLLKEIPGSPLQNAVFGCNLNSGVSAEILASAVSHLHIVHLCCLTTEQCVALLKAILSSDTLTILSLNVYLSKVPPELLANSISRLQDVNLRFTALTTDQLVALLKASLSSTTLTNVSLEGAKLSEVPAELLANSISRLQVVNLSCTKLTTEQCVALLKASISSTSLTNVNLYGANLSKVPAELLANSISRLQDVNLHLTYLTTEQCIALLKASLSSTTLTNVDLGFVDLSEVPAELLANSISRLQEVYLCATNPTTEQCAALLNAIRSSSKTVTIKANPKHVLNLSEFTAELLEKTLKSEAFRRNTNSWRRNSNAH